MPPHCDLRATPICVEASPRGAGSTCQTHLNRGPAAPHDLTGLLGPARYRRSGDELVGRGPYFDLPPWGFHLFRIQAIG